jgi:hypothetical protein
MLESPTMKIRDYAHLGAAARLEQLQAEIAKIHREFPGLKRTTPLGMTSTKKRSARSRQRAKKKAR